MPVRKRLRVLGPLGGVERPRSWRTFGPCRRVPAFSGNSSLACLPHRVVRYECRAVTRRRPGPSTPTESAASCRHLTNQPESLTASFAFWWPMREANGATGCLAEHVLP